MDLSASDTDAVRVDLSIVRLNLQAVNHWGIRRRD